MAEIEYELIQIEDFIEKFSVSGDEYIPFGKDGSFRVKASTLVKLVSENLGFIKSNSLIPINKRIDDINDDILIIDNEILLKLDKSSVIDNLTTVSSSNPLSARQGKILNDLIGSFVGQIGSGIIGEAKTDTVPISEGFGIYTVSESGIYVNFKDINGQIINVSQEDIDSGLVQLWGNDNEWTTHITLIDVFTPVFSDNLSDI